MQGDVVSGKFSFYKACCGPATLRRGFVVAVVVGTLLGAINHGHEWLTLSESHWWQVVATYVIPFLVSIHGSAAAKMRMQRQGGVSSPDG